MRWQKAARIAIAIAVVAFTAVVFIALRRNRPPAAPVPSPRTDDTASIESTDRIVHKRTNREGKLLFSIVADGGSTLYPDGRVKFKKARLTLPDRGGRTLEVSSDEMDVTAPPGKSSELATAKMNGHVRMTASDGLVVTAGEAAYDQPTGILQVPGEVQFSRERLKGSGVGATYDEAREVLWLLKDARVSIAPDAQGQGAAEGSAATAGFARAEHYMRLTGSGKIVGDGRTAEADDITIQLSDDEKRMRAMQLRGNSRITGTAGGSAAAAQNMAARDIDLTYADDGKALQQAVLTENASVQLPGAAGAAARRVAARNITMGLAPDGTTVTSLTANEQVQVELPAEGEASGRRITASALVASGAPDQGLRTATFTGNVEFREARPGGRGTPASERIARSQRLIVETKPGFGDIQQADFRGNVRFEDGATVGEAPRGIYNVAGDTLQLSPSTGDPGPPPRLSDKRMSVDAGSLTLALKTRKLTAITNVRSSLQPSGKGDGRPSSAGERAAGADDGTRLPSMLKSDEPVFVNSNQLEYDGTSNAVYTGEAKLFQGQTTVAGDTITLDDRNGNMTAQGKVRTVMFFDDVDPKTKERKPAQTTGTADQLVYEDSKRLATYTTGPSANAHIVGPQGDVAADVIRLFLKPKANELERAEADGKVTVKEGQRRAKGDHLIYTAADEVYVMKGNPLEVDRYAPGECTRTMGVTLRFRRGDDTLVVDGIPGVTPFNTKPIPCS
jgi:lipopolysaccharide export system protein LptA